MNMKTKVHYTYVIGDEYTMGQGRRAPPQKKRKDRKSGISNTGVGEGSRASSIFKSLSKVNLMEKAICEQT